MGTNHQCQQAPPHDAPVSFSSLASIFCDNASIVVDDVRLCPLRSRRTDADVVLRAEGKALHVFTNSLGSPQGHFINMAWSPDGRYIACGDKADVVTLFDVAAAKQVATFRIHPDEANEMVFGNASDRLYVTCSGNICVLAVPSLAPLFAIKAHQAQLLAIDMDPYGR